MEPTANDSGKKSDSTLDDAIAKVPSPVSNKDGFPLTDSTTKKKNGKQKRRWHKWGIPAIIVALIVVILVCLYVFGYVFAGFKNPKQVVVLQTQICSNEDISNYNKAMSDFRFDDPDSMSGLRDLANNIKAKEKYNEDPTCVYIVYMNASMTQDRETAKIAGERLVEMNEQGQFVNNRIFNVVGIDTISGFLERLNSGQVEQINADGAEQQ